MSQAKAGVRLLFAEDEVTFREPIAKLFRKQGYECVCAGTFKEAANAASAGSIDVLLMDICMPGNSGLKLAREVLDISPSTSVQFSWTETPTV